MTAIVCRQCSAETTLMRLSRVEGEDSGIHIVIEGLPALDCANGHKRFPSPDFPLQFIQRLVGADELITAEPAAEKGLFRKRAVCPACGESLPDSSSRASTHQAQLDVADTGAVTVELSLPIYPCEACGQEATLPQKGVESGVMQAVANAFRSADVPPG